ncbi:MAG: hypothetical protein LUG98_10690 [Tannerellaceae bacterium]|nr:hypothetical protein [Tannerellaceae bacterium]
MKKIFSYVLTGVFSFLVLTLPACKDDNETPQLKVSATTFTLEAMDITQTFTIQSNVGWVIHSSEKWCTIAPEYGSGTQQITITLDGENSDLRNARSATLTIQSGQADTQTIEIEQKALSTPTSDNEIIITTPGHPDDRTGFKIWYYFSFEKGEIVGTGEANTPADDEAWYEDLSWDIAFTRVHVRSNSGTSGIGNGGAIEIGANQEDKEKVFNELIEVPTEGYQTDEYGTGLMFTMPPALTKEYSYSPVLNAYCTLNLASMGAVTTPKIFAVRTAAGKYAKIYLKDNMDGVITMQYAYQPDGTPNLATTE